MALPTTTHAHIVISAKFGKVLQDGGQISDIGNASALISSSSGAKHSGRKFPTAHVAVPVSVVEVDSAATVVEQRHKKTSKRIIPASMILAGWLWLAL
mmetsp:Transcript_32719/g.64445  ORF Transcript_32719/g.64445 Transcript_32719/m.64445 type:complete len:98 (+) Transcript_32719:1105-1398(+)